MRSRRAPARSLAELSGEYPSSRTTLSTRLRVLASTEGVPLITRETVIVDTPALTAVSDGLLIAAQTDSALMVVSAAGTDEHGARKAIDQLALFGIENVLGIVVNKEAATASDYDDYFARMHNALAAGNA